MKFFNNIRGNDICNQPRLQLLDLHGATFEEVVETATCTECCSRTAVLGVEEKITHGLPSIFYAWFKVLI